jgi:hypothetical protein
MISRTFGSGVLLLVLTAAACGGTGGEPEAPAQNVAPATETPLGGGGARVDTLTAPVFPPAPGTNP